MRPLLFALAAVVCLGRTAAAQDPVKVDPKHHKVEAENDQVRVLRISIGPGEKTPVHEHPAIVVVYLNDSHNRVSPVGGKPDETPRKGGTAVAMPATKHVVENIGTTPAEIIVVELKARPAK